MLCAPQSYQLTPHLQNPLSVSPLWPPEPALTWQEKPELAPLRSSRHPVRTGWWCANALAPSPRWRGRDGLVHLCPAGLSRGAHSGHCGRYGGRPSCPGGLPSASHFSTPHWCFLGHCPDESCHWHPWLCLWGNQTQIISVHACVSCVSADKVSGSGWQGSTDFQGQKVAGAEEETLVELAEWPGDQTQERGALGRCRQEPGG